MAGGQQETESCPPNYITGDRNTMYNYSELKALASERGCTVQDLIALAAHNDPFYAGKPADIALAEWFAGLWRKFGYNSGIHIRRVHYQIISQDPPVSLPNGSVYENTDICWNALNQAAKMARYLGLVNAELFVDKRNPDPLIHTSYEWTEPEIEAQLNLWTLPSVPDFPELPAFNLYNYSVAQTYDIELWCEKSTMNDVLIPICEEYGANLQTGLGELSITATLAVAKRIQQRNKPTVIFYISDFDPAGKSMPVAVSRKLEFFIRKLGILPKVSLIPIVLTEQQVSYYQLPRTPIKDSETRGKKFEEKHGTGAVELDALEALYPGELRRIVVSAIERYYDASLPQRLAETRNELQEQLDNTERSVLGWHLDEIADLRTKYAQISKQITELLEDFNNEVRELWHTIQQELEDDKPTIVELPEPYEAHEIDNPLFDSERDYLEQIACYKAFQQGG
jgi:hypothetical protein